MNKLDILKYLLESNTALSVPQILLGLCLACILSFIMYLVYKLTYRGTVYSKNFNSTLVLIAIIVTVVMSIIGSNLALSLGMVGSLSIIRFRTAIKEPRDIAFIFWAIAIGLSCGSEIYLVGILGSIVLVLVMVLFNLDIYAQTSYILVMETNLETGSFTNILKKYTKNYKLRMQNVNNDKREITFELSINNKMVDGLIKEINSIKEIHKYNLVSFNGEIAG